MFDNVWHFVFVPEVIIVSKNDYSENEHFYIKLVERLIPRRLLCKLSYTTMHACPTSTQHHPNLAGSLLIAHSEKGHSWLFFFISHFFEEQREEKVMKNLKQRKTSGHHALLPVGPVCLNSSQNMEKVL